MEPITVLFGVPTEVDWQKCDNRMIVRRMIVTQPEINGKTLSQLKIRSHFGANITRVNRADVDLVAAPYLNLQLGDKVTVVGTELAVSQTEKVLGNSMKRLNYPNLIPIFLGIALGCILANMPIIIPGIPQYLKLGLTGGPLIAAILIGYIGPKHRLITYNTISANLMLREIGFCIFLACVGLGLGKEFMNIVISQGGLTWRAYAIRPYRFCQNGLGTSKNCGRYFSTEIIDTSSFRYFLPAKIFTLSYRYFLVLQIETARRTGTFWCCKLKWLVVPVLFDGYFYNVKTYRYFLMCEKTYFYRYLYFGVKSYPVGASTR